MSERVFELVIVLLVFFADTTRVVYLLYTCGTLIPALLELF